MEYNNRNGLPFTHSHFTGLGERFIRKLRIRRFTANPQIQPTYLSTLSGSLSMDRLFDPASLPKLQKDAQPANLAGTDRGSHFFRVLLAVPVKGTWDSPRDGRPHLLWDYHCDRSGASPDFASYQSGRGSVGTDRGHIHS